MEPELKRRLIYTGIIFTVLIGGRIGWLAYERRDEGSAPVRKEAVVTNQDDLVKTHKIFAYDVKSAKKELVGKPVWVRAGNQIPYYHYNAASQSVNFQKQAGLLAPIEKLTVEDIILQKAPAKLASGQVAISQKQIMVVFKIDGDASGYAISIGSNVGEDYTLTINELLLAQDPHEMYKHWSAEIWSAIARHEVKEGMNELQAQFALGTDMELGPGEAGDRVVEFGNLGRPVQVTFARNKAVKVVQAP
ncbi:MAG TPA: hypothetical protein VNW97_16760 [Candidatus Saccharimonadales bacterium]|jgi:hypothetical protein|nr:hypothetical protein [Candidatus Saccharimonadales bacterium]